MSTIDKFLAGALALIGVYLLVSTDRSAGIIQTLGGTGGGIFGVLQGRDVDFGGVKIGRGYGG